MIAQSQEFAKSGFNFVQFFANTTLDGIERLSLLNLAAARSVFETSATNLNTLLGAKDVQSFINLQQSISAPSIEKGMEYSRNVFAIAAETKDKITKEVETHAADANAKVSNLVEKALTSAPAGSEVAVAAVKSAIKTASDAYQGLNKAAKQAAEVAEASVSAATKATLRAAFGHKRFIGTMAIVFLWNGATTLSATALDVHLLERVGVPYLYIAGASASLFVFMLLLSRLWHRLLRRFGWYRTLACMVLAYVPVTVLLGFAAPGNYAWLYPLCRGVQQGLYAGIVIVLANLPYMNLPQNDHTSFFSFHTLTANLSSFFGQMLGTLMVAFGGKLALGGYGVVTFMMCLHGALLVLLGIYVLRAEKRLTGE